MEKDEEIEKTKVKILESYDGSSDMSIFMAAVTHGSNMGRFWAWRKKDREFDKKCREAVARRAKKKGGDLNPMKNGDMVKLASKARSEQSEMLRKKWLAAYKTTNFNIGEACELIGITRKQYGKWRERFPAFREEVEEAIEFMKDYIEGKLLKNIGDGDSQCIIFACETKLKDRGYIKKQMFEHSGNFGVMIAPARIEDQDEWAAKATKQQKQLKERSMKTDYIKELEE